MCSIFGFYKLNNEATIDPEFDAKAFGFMRHRGPDAENFLDLGSVGFGFNIPEFNKERENAKALLSDNAGWKSMFALDRITSLAVVDQLYKFESN